MPRKCDAVHSFEGFEPGLNAVEGRSTSLAGGLLRGGERLSLILWSFYFYTAGRIKRLAAKAPILDRTENFALSKPAITAGLHSRVLLKDGSALLPIDAITTRSLVMRSPKSDPQEWRAYTWEEQLMAWAGPRATKAEIKEVVARCCRVYRVPPPTIKFVAKDKRGGRKLQSDYDPRTHTIVLRPRHRELYTAIHEAAHAIISWVLGNVSQLHGKEWLGLNMVLLARNRILPLSVLQHHARTRRLQFCAARRVLPETIRTNFPSKVRRAARERQQER
jgi:hypothetical protein